MKLTLGTVQFGLKYGVANDYKQVSISQAHSILDLFLLKGGRDVDTASSYGNSESVIGNFHQRDKLSIVTKIPGFKKDIITYRDKDEILRSFDKSLKKLEIENCETLLIHNCEDLFKKNGYLIYEALRNIKNCKKVKKIGVSIYESEDIYRIINNFDFDVIQLPFNLYNQSLLNDGTLDKLKKIGVEIHARSIFLQGLLLISNEKWPPYFNELQSHHKKSLEFLKLNNLTILEACLGFVNSISQIDKILVGVNTKEQLYEIFRDIKKEFTIKNFKELDFKDKKIINPKFWPRI